MTDTLGDFFLFFSHTTFILPLLILGYIWIDKKYFYHATCLILTSIILNYALKSSFKIPLAPFLNKEGFAFPNGHMQASASLYGWLALYTSNKYIHGCMAAFLLGIGISLIHFGYHNYVDVLGGGVCAGLLLMVYYTTAQYKPQLLPWIMFLFTTCLMVYIDIGYKIQPHIWRDYYVLLGLIVSSQFFNKKICLNHFSQKIWATGISFSLIFIIKKLFFDTGPVNLPPFLSRLKWGGGSIPLSNALAHHFNGFFKKKM